MTERDLLNLKEEIDEAKSSVAELKGQQTVLRKQLKDTYGCQSTEEAEALIAKWKKDIEKLQIKIDEGIKELEEKYNV